MTYATNTITGSSTGPADLRTVIEGLLVAQGSWGSAPVDSYTASTFNVHVWKNNGPTPFYLALNLNTAAPTNLVFKVFEDYTVATHLGIRGVTANNVLDVASGSGYGNTGYAPEATQWTAGYLLSCPSSSFTYRVRVTANGVIAQSSASANPIYAGLFTPIWSHANEFPLMMWLLGGSSLAGFTRRPGAASAATTNFEVSSSPDFFDGAYGTLGQSDTLCGTRIYSSRVKAKMSSTITGQTELCRGYLDTDLLVVNPVTAAAAGDTVTINGVTYVGIFKSSSVSLTFLRTD